MIRLDEPRFTPEGRPLVAWLRDLVDPDMEVRDRAATTLNRMKLNAPPGWMDEPNYDLQAYFEGFDEAVRLALDEPGFDARTYVNDLIDAHEAAGALRMGLWDREKARTDRVMDRIAKRLGEHPTPEAAAHAVSRIGRVCCTSLDPKNLNMRDQNRLLMQQVVMLYVIGALRGHLLLIADRVRSLIRERSNLRHQMLRGLARLGPEGSPFAGDLLALLDGARGPSGYFDGAEALASIARHDASLTRQVASRLRSAEPGVVAGSASTLARIGPEAEELAPGTLAALVAIAGRAGDPCRSAAIDAVGRIGRGRRTLVEAVLAWSLDADVWVVGAALSALGRIGRRPELAVPRLVAALDDYEEPDPDWCQEGAHERVAEALAAFGPDAAPAAHALASRLVLDDEDGRTDRCILRALGAIGPAARGTLPALEALARDHADLDDPDDPIVAAIRRIGGESGPPRPPA